MANYVNNEKMFKELVKYKDEYNKWKKIEKSLPDKKPTPSDSLVKMIELISINYSKKSNFIGYTWKQDMIQEAIHTCLKYLHNFNTDKYSNPFAYFTLVIHRAFLTYIKKQNKHSKIKDELYNTYDDSDSVSFGGFKTMDYTMLKPSKNKINVVCYMCGLKWYTNDVKKSSCPKCNSSRIYRPLSKPIKIMCNECGNEWLENLNKDVKYCPKCDSYKLYKPIKFKK
jgi:predicted Zn-ribbon and HTH transcriptional regulator